MLPENRAVMPAQVRLLALLGLGSSQTFQRGQALSLCLESLARWLAEAVPTRQSHTPSLSPEPFTQVPALVSYLHTFAFSVCPSTSPTYPSPPLTLPTPPPLPPGKLALSQGPGSGNPEHLQTQRKGSLMVELEAPAERYVLELAPRGEMCPLLCIRSGLFRSRVLA